MAKVTGAAVYTADVSRDGLVYAVLVQSEIPRGRVTETSLRASADRAAAEPGVVAVITPLNCPAIEVLPRDLTDDLPFERRPPLSDLTVQHVGQHMAIVVADSLENATEAAAGFALEYEVEPAQLTAREVCDQPTEPDAENGEIRHGSYLPDHYVKLTEEKLQDSRGDAPTGASIAITTEATFSTALNAHYPIELSATIAEWDGDHLTVHDGSRWIVGERTALAASFGIPPENVRVISRLVGGAFGSKSFLWMHVVLCAAAARVVARPVKLVLTRDQMFSSTGHRPRTEQRISLTADRDGTLSGTEHHTLTETSTVAHFCEPAGLSTRLLYNSPYVVVSHRAARINAPTPSFMRGPGEAPGLFALEVAMDELAHQVGLDPLALRVRNHAEFDQASGKQWSGKHLLECYSTGAERFGWDERPSAPRVLRRDGLLVGWGMATATYPGQRSAASCGVVTTDAGQVEFASATHEIGTGVRTVMTQVAADAVGLPLSQVAFASGDTLYPPSPYSGGSQTTATVGSAVFAAGTEWKRRFRALLTADSGSPFHGVAPESVEISEGLVRSGAIADVTASVRDILAAGGESYRRQLTFTTDSDGAKADDKAFQSFGAHFCEVEVDERIGRATVTRWVSVMDCGRILNPKLARNQVMGGIIFGVGMALLEQVPYDATTAQLLGEYYLPTHADRPEFDISFVDTPDYALDPIGARGIGEIGLCGAPAAIANAIFHATGRQLRDLPITLEHLMTPYPDHYAKGQA